MAREESRFRTGLSARYGMTTFQMATLEMTTFQMATLEITIFQWRTSAVKPVRGELMGRWGKKLFANYKRRGEWVELLFMTVASGLGFNVAKPFGDSARYDVVVENEGRFLRIQVKSTESMVGGCYSCQLHVCGNRLYTPKEIDYFALYILPKDVWYIFPAKTLAGMSAVALAPHLKGHKYERYMENWWLLTRHHFRRGARTVVPPGDGRPGSVDRLSARIVERIRGMGQEG
jgi:PD-(D/E)XK endonuclease